MFDEFEVEIRFQRTDGVDRAFATDKDYVGTWIARCPGTKYSSAEYRLA
jgi:hypothetical protein